MVKSRLATLALSGALLAAYGLVVLGGRAAGARPTSDCEQVGERLLAQPAGALSALAFLAVALWLASRSPGRAGRIHAAAAAALGVGSFGFHGLPAAWTGWVDSAAIAAYAAFWLAYDLAALGRVRQLLTTAGAVGGAAGLALAVFPPGAEPIVLGLLIGAAVLGEAAVLVSRRGRPDTRLMAGVAVLMAGQVVFHLSRTGRPWCDPDSVLQGHAAWHVLAAVAVGLFGLYLERRERICA